MNHKTYKTLESDSYKRDTSSALKLYYLNCIEDDAMQIYVCLRYNIISELSILKLVQPNDRLS